MHTHRLTPGGATPALAGFVLLATCLVCLWIGTYQEFAAVGIRGALYTPVWAVPLAAVVGVGGALLALVIYRQGRQR
jgi:hypothetical protein